MSRLLGVEQEDVHGEGAADSSARARWSGGRRADANVEAKIVGSRVRLTPRKILTFALRSCIVRTHSRCMSFSLQLFINQMNEPVRIMF